MEITWYGHSCFRLTERSMATVVTDPYDNKSIGYFPLKLLLASRETPVRDVLLRWHRVADRPRRPSRSSGRTPGCW